MEGNNKKFDLRYAAIIVAAIVIVGILVVYMATNNNAQVVSNGDNVSVYYSGSYANGTVFQSNFGKTPLNFTVGANEMIKGFDQGVIGMKVGETKNITIPPSEAYGEVNQSLIITVPRTSFGNALVTNGMLVSATTGQQGIVTGLTNNSVVIDFNPPLAGKTLNFEIKVIAIRPPKKI